MMKPEKGSRQMQKIEFLYLSREDVIKVGISMPEAIAVAEAVFREQGHRRFENPPKPGVHPQPDAFIHAMPGYLPGRQAAGLKWVSGFSGNFKQGLPNIIGLMILNDPQTGKPLAVMDCSWITQIRTGAVSAVAARYLARQDAQVVGIVGAGVQGRAHALALKEVLPQMKEIKVFDINEEIVDHFVTSMRKMLPFAVEKTESAKRAINEADVIVTATGRLSKPIFKLSWVRPGALILPVHTRGWEKDTPARVDKFVVDHWDQFRQAQEREGGYYESLPDLYAELGDIVAGTKPGRENEIECIIDHNYGMAIQDVALGKEIFQRAAERELGSVLPLMEATDLVASP
jgi:ornithine cyclodeaminase/alanine dehydrogenase-like protein (mu-crystallin family)